MLVVIRYLGYWKYFFKFGLEDKRGGGVILNLSFLSEIGIMWMVVWGFGGVWFFSWIGGRIEVWFYEFFFFRLFYMIWFWKISRRLNGFGVVMSRYCIEVRVRVRGFCEFGLRSILFWFVIWLSWWGNWLEIVIIFFFVFS